MRCVVSCGSTSFPGLYSSLELCCEGPRFTSIQEDGCDKGAHQSYLGADRNTLVNSVVFSLVNAAVVCAILESISGLEPSSVITEPRYLVLDACDCLQLLSIHFNLCVDATGVACHQLGLLCTDLHAVGCEGFACSSSSPAKPSMSSARRMLVIVLPPMLTVPS